MLRETHQQVTIVSMEFYLIILFYGAVSPKAPKQNSEPNDKENSMSSRIESLTIEEDVKEGEAEDEDVPIHPYDRLMTTSTDPVAEIDVTKREVVASSGFTTLYLIHLFNHVLRSSLHEMSQMYLSSAEFREKFGMTKDAFYKLPKWRQNKLKMALHLF